MVDSSQQSEWYEDPDVLVGALVDERRDRMGTPDVPGYDEFEEIGRGGQGVVFTARQRSTQRTVAIKILLGGAYASSSAHARFRREVDLVTRLRHPNIVHVYDSGVTGDGCPYLVMEHVDGEPLDLHARVSVETSRATSSRTRSPELVEQLTLFAKICDAVQYAHQRGIIHRDLKPNNILVDDQGQPKILDFGVAAATSEVDGPTISMTGQFIGSLPWASPEQVADHGAPADVRSDVYALGVMLVQLLTGRFPYNVSTAVSRVVDSILHVDPIRPSSIVTRLNDEIDTIVMTCLAKEAERRYQSAGAVADDIRRFLNREPIQAKRDSAWYQMRKLAGRYRATVAFTASALVLTIVFLVFMTVAYRDAREAERLAADRLVTVTEANERAQREMSKARAVNEFLEKMLSSSDPTVLDRDITVRETLENAVTRIDAEFAELPEVEASLRNCIGWTYFNLGQFDRAERQLSKAIAVVADGGSVEPKDALEIKHRLVQVYLSQDRIDDANQLSTEVLSAAKALFGEDAWLTLSAMAVHADVLKSQGQLAAAMQLQEEMIRRGEATLGAEHAEILVARNHFAIMQIELGMFAEAEATYRALIEIRRRRGDRAAVVTLQQNLASTLSRLGRYGEARALFEAVVDDASDVFGPNHPQTLSALYNLASLLVNLELYGVAAEMTSALVDRYATTFGEGHEETLQARNQLAVIHLYQSKWSEAEKELRETLDGYLRREGQPVPSVIYQNLAGALRGQGKLDEALIMVSKALAVSDAQYGETYPERVGILNELGRVRMEMGDASAALEDFRDAHQTAKAVFPEDHPYVFIMKISMAKALVELNDTEPAAELLMAAHEGLVEALGVDHGEAEKAARYLAEIFERSGDNERQRFWLARAGAVQSPDVHE